MRIALYQPDIPQNTGNIFRLGACLGVPVDVIEPTGFIFDDKKFLKWVKNNQGRLILMTTKSEKSYYNFKFQPSDILLFGRESAGVPNDVHDIADHRLTIPMKNEVRSINLSSSVALVIGEGLRQINGI